MLSSLADLVVSEELPALGKYLVKKELSGSVKLASVRNAITSTAFLIRYALPVKTIPGPYDGVCTEISA